MNEHTPLLAAIVDIRRQVGASAMTLWDMERGGTIPPEYRHLVEAALERSGELWHVLDELIERIGDGRWVYQKNPVPYQREGVAV